MQFGEIGIDEAAGAILAHAHRDGRLNFAKGRRLSPIDVAALKAADVKFVIAAKLAPDDVHEDEAARIIAEAVMGAGLTATAPFTGRANLFAAAAGVVVADQARLDAINDIDESITIATLPGYAAASAKQMVATIKIIPFAVPRAAVERALAVVRDGGPMVSVAPFRAMRAGLVQTSLPGTRDKALDKTTQTTRARIVGLGGTLVGERRVRHDESEIAGALSELAAEGCDLFLIAGASAIVDRRDTIPLGIEKAGGHITHFGMPVDPGNLLLMGELGGKPAIGLPGCAKSPKFNGFDMVLQRLAADLPVRRSEIVRMGAGGLLEETTMRGVARSGEDGAARSEAQHAPRIAALILAAGRSSRMGPSNKLLADIEGTPMVARVVRAAMMSHAVMATVVLGHMADDVRRAVASLGDVARNVRFVKNPDFAQGLSTSLKVGVATLPTDIDGALVLLGDMPDVTPAQLNKLIAAFNPVEGRSICLPTVAGKRGNPVLWARRFFPEMGNVSGDTGARHLIGEHAEQVCEVAMDGETASDGVLVDLDTPEALAAYRARRA